MKIKVAIIILSATTALTALAESGDSSSALLAALSSPNFETRRSAAIELHKLGDNSGVPLMIEAMSTLTNETERNNAVVALRVMKDPRAIPILMRTTSDSSAYVRAISLAALGELTATNAYDTLIAHLDDIEDFGGCTPMCPGDSACYALGALGNTNAIPHLIKALDQERTQSQACQALEKLTGESFRYDAEMWKKWWSKQETQQAGPAYPPQGVGSADP